MLRHPGIAFRPTSTGGREAGIVGRRLYVWLDEMLDASVAIQLRDRAVDVIAVQECSELQGLEDRQVLLEADRDGRALVTGNVRHFLPLHQRLLAGGDHHSGPVLASSRSLARSKATVGLWVRAIQSFEEARSGTPSLDDRCCWLDPPEVPDWR